MTIATTPDVSAPLGAEADDWQHDAAQPYRLVFGELRIIGGAEYTTVQATAIQLSDGRIDDGGTCHGPCVYLGDDGLTSSQARELAAALVAAANEADAWLTK